MINLPRIKDQGTCNDCGRNNCKGFIDLITCKNWVSCEVKVPLVQLALAYPESLNKALSQFPKIKLHRYI